MSSKGKDKDDDVEKELDQLLGDMKYPLMHPIKAHNEEMSVISFREPVSMDIINIGNPVIMDPAAEPPQITHDSRKMTAMMARLASVPPSTIAQMHPKDWVGCAWMLTNFFLPPPGRI